MQNAPAPSPAGSWRRCWVVALALAVGSVTAEETVAVREPEALANHYCRGCHGAGGQGDDPRFPKLAGQNVGYLLRHMQKFRSGERRGAVMIYALNRLSESERAALAVYFSTRPRTVAAGGGTDGEGRGARLFDEGDARLGLAPCAACHERAADDGGLMPRLAGQHAAYLAEQIQRFNEGRRVAGQSATHPAPLPEDAEQIEAVSHFLAAFKRLR